MAIQTAIPAHTKMGDGATFKKADGPKPPRLLVALPEGMREQCIRVRDLNMEREFKEARAAFTSIIDKISNEPNVQRRFEALWNLMWHLREMYKTGEIGHEYDVVFGRALETTALLEFPARLRIYCSMYEELTADGAVGKRDTVFQCAMNDILSHKNEYTREEPDRIAALASLAACFGRYDKNGRNKTIAEIEASLVKMLAGCAPDKPAEMADVVFTVIEILRDRGALNIAGLDVWLRYIPNIDHLFLGMFSRPETWRNHPARPSFLNTRIDYMCRLLWIVKSAVGMEKDTDNIRGWLAGDLTRATMKCGKGSILDTARLFIDIARRIETEEADGLFARVCNDLKGWTRYITDVTELCEAAAIICPSSRTSARAALDLARKVANGIEDPEKHAIELGKVNAKSDELRL